MAKDRMYIGKGDKELFEKVEMDNHFNFKNKNYKDKFMLAMAVGSNSGKEGYKIEKKEELFHLTDLKEEDIALIVACALKKAGTEILDNMDKVYEIAENYAHIGIKLLADKVDSCTPDTFEKEYEVSIMSLYKELGIDS